jgi:hypothetical protein
MAVTFVIAPEIPPDRAVNTATVATATTARTTAYSAIVCPFWRCCRDLMRSRSGESLTGDHTPWAMSGAVRTELVRSLAT